MILSVKKLLTAALVVLVIAPIHAAEFQYGLNLGFREDDLRWDIAGTSVGTNPNVLSELTWSAVRSAQLSGFARAYFNNRWYLEADAGYGRIFSGDVQDSDFLSNNRQDEFSRSHADANKGHMFDGQFALGYQFGQRNGRLGSSMLFIPVVGYAYNSQDLSMTNGIQVIPASLQGPFDGLNSEYNARWFGPFIGFRAQYDRNRNFGVFMSYDYHEAQYRAEAIWNLRPDFAQDPSFKHRADGQGHVLGAGVRFTPWKKWTVAIEGEYRKWKTDPGHDVVFASSFGLTGSTRLNSVKWDSWSVMLTPMFRF